LAGNDLSLSLLPTGLEESRDDLEKIARHCGLGSVQALRRSFLRVLRVAPSEYRQRFSKAAQDAAAKSKSDS
jgi:transcriptional regulator GlxA family with amidase domain